jgi:hypothetical protein
MIRLAMMNLLMIIQVMMEELLQTPITKEELL